MGVRGAAGGGEGRRNRQISATVVEGHERLAAHCTQCLSARTFMSPCSSMSHTILLPVALPLDAMCVSRTSARVVCHVESNEEERGSNRVVSFA